MSNESLLWIMGFLRAWTGRAIDKCDLLGLEMIVPNAATHFSAGFGELVSLDPERIISAINEKKRLTIFEASEMARGV
jgi:hypothetical protein